MTAEEKARLSRSSGSPRRNPAGRLHGPRVGAQRLPLARFELADVALAEEAEPILSRELTDLRILRVEDPQSFRLQVHGAHLGNARVTFNRFGARTLVDPGRLGDFVIFSFGHARSAVVHVEGKPVLTAPTSAAVISPAGRLRIDRSAGSGMFLVRVFRSDLEQHFTTLTGTTLEEPLRFSRHVDLSREPGATAHRIALFVISELDAVGPAGLEAAPFRRALEELLFSAVLSLPGNHAETLTRGHRGRLSPRLVRVAEEVMRARAHEPVKISDLLGVCGCSRSVLFEAFQRYRDYTPQQFLHSTRMDRARELLVSGSAASVTEVAHDCGFRHLGRFAGEYRRRFEERPSVTLSQNARATPTRDI